MTDSQPINYWFTSELFQIEPGGDYLSGRRLT
jgi:hypothetical protein